jgi:calcineurin-like phosphoesterase
MTAGRVFTVIVATIAVSLILGCQTDTANTGAPFETSFDKAMAAAADKEQNVLLDFYTDW